MGEWGMKVTSESEGKKMKIQQENDSRKTIKARSVYCFIARSKVHRIYASVGDGELIDVEGGIGD